jgi:hypothetical protein
MIDRTLRTVVGAQFRLATAYQRSRSSLIVVWAPTVGVTFALRARQTSSRCASVLLPRTVRVTQRRRPVSGSVPPQTRSSQEAVPRWRIEPVIPTISTGPAATFRDLQGSVMGKSRALMGDHPPMGATPPLTCTFIGADDGIRTRDPHLGKVMESVHRVRCAPSRALAST